MWPFPRRDKPRRRVDFSLHCCTTGVGHQKVEVERSCIAPNPLAKRGSSSSPPSPQLKADHEEGRSIGEGGPVCSGTIFVAPPCCDKKIRLSRYLNFKRPYLPPSVFSTEQVLSITEQVLSHTGGITNKNTLITPRPRVIKTNDEGCQDFTVSNQLLTSQKVIGPALFCDKQVQQIGPIFQNQFSILDRKMSQMAK